MAHHILTLDSLPLLDEGKAAAAFDKLLKAATLDCLDRPFEDKPRKVTIEIQLTPIPNSDRIKAQIFLAPKNPAFRTREYDLAARVTGGLIFSEDSPDSVDQQTFPMDRDEDN